MIFSMTGYATVREETSYGSFNLEIRSVNNRFLDIQLRLPDDFRRLETAMRELLTAQLGRGKIECRMVFSHAHAVEIDQQFDHGLLERLMQLEQTIRTHYPSAASLTVAEILRWPGILENDTTPNEEWDEVGMRLLQTALKDLKAARMREGDKLKSVLFDRISQMRQLLQAASPRIPALIAAFEEKLRIRLEEILGGNEDERIHQEITLFASKIDVDEELSRLQAHLDEVERILNQGGAVGKRLDFMMQELHREANTIGSKSVDLEISRIAMELKVLVEQMREQVQNIE